MGRDILINTGSPEVEPCSAWIFRCNCQIMIIPLLPETLLGEVFGVFLSFSASVRVKRSWICAGCLQRVRKPWILEHRTLSFHILRDEKKKEVKTKFGLISDWNLFPSCSIDVNDGRNRKATPDFIAFHLNTNKKLKKRKKPRLFLLKTHKQPLVSSRVSFVTRKVEIKILCDSKTPQTWQSNAT